MALGLNLGVASGDVVEASESWAESIGRSLTLVDARDRRCGRDDDEAACRVVDKVLDLCERVLARARIGKVGVSAEGREALFRRRGSLK